MPFPQIDYQSDRNLFRMKQPQPLPLPQSAQLSSSPFRCSDGNGDVSIKRFVRFSSSRTTQLQESKTSILPVVKKKSNAVDGNDFSNLTLLTRQILIFFRPFKHGSNLSVKRIRIRALKFFFIVFLSDLLIDR